MEPVCHLPNQMQAKPRADSVALFGGGGGLSYLNSSFQSNPPRK